MDAMITNRMTQAKERDERSLGLFNQLRERRGPKVRTSLCQEASFILNVVYSGNIEVAQCQLANKHGTHGSTGGHRSAGELRIINSITHRLIRARSHVHIQWMLQVRRPRSR